MITMSDLVSLEQHNQLRQSKGLPIKKVRKENSMNTPLYDKVCCSNNLAQDWLQEEFGIKTTRAKAGKLSTFMLQVWEEGWTVGNRKHVNPEKEE